MANDLSEAGIELIVEAVREALRNEGPTALPGVLRLPEDERLRTLVEEVIDRKLTLFEKAVEAIVRREIEGSLRRIGIRIDDAHIDQTSEDFRSMMKTHRNINRLATGLGLTLVTGMVFGLLKLLGLNIGGGIGGEH